MATLVKEKSVKKKKKPATSTPTNKNSAPQPVEIPDLESDTLNEISNDYTDESLLEILTPNETSSFLEVSSPQIEETIDKLEELEVCDAQPSAPNISVVKSEQNITDLGIPCQQHVSPQKELLSRSFHEEIKPLSYEEIEQMYGNTKIYLSRSYCQAFQLKLDSTVYKDIKFYRKLISYRDMFNMVTRDKGRIDNMFQEADKKQVHLWTVKKKMANESEWCADNVKMDVYVEYNEAEFNKEKAKICPIYYKDALGETVESLCLRQHYLLLFRNKIEDMVVGALSNETVTKEYIQVLFHLLDVANHDTEKEFVKDLEVWCYYLCAHMLSNNCLSNQLFFVHHLVRQSHGSMWAANLLQPRIDETFDYIELLCLIEAILFDHSAVSASKEPLEGRDVWEVVEGSGDFGGALDTNKEGNQAAILPLLNRIPLREVYKALLPFHDQSQLEDEFASVTESELLRSCCLCRLLLERLYNGVKTDLNLPSITQNKCRSIALNALLVVNDVRSLCNCDITPKTQTELEQLFQLALSIFKSCSKSDHASYYMSEMPYEILTDRSKEKYYQSIVDRIEFANERACPYLFEALINISKCADEQLSAVIVDYFFKLSFVKLDEHKSWRGELASKCLGRLLKYTPALYTQTLAQIALHYATSPETVKAEMLSNLELANYRPSSPEISQLFDQWINSCPQMLPSLIASMDYGPPFGIKLEVQRAIAFSLINYARKIQNSKKPIPKWLYTALKKLKLHYTDWLIQLQTAPSAEQLGFSEFVNLDEDLLFGMFLILSSNWGHSVPLICECGTNFLLKLIEADKKEEAIHCLKYVMIVMMDAPESISVTPSFCTLLKKLLTPQSYVKQLWTPDITEGLLGDVIEQHLIDSEYRCADVWCEFLSLDACGMKLLDRIGMRIMHRRPLRLPENMTILELHSRCYPHIQLPLLRFKHYTKELALWPSLLCTLHMQRNGIVSVDNAIQGLEGLGKSSELVIYKAAEAALQTTIENHAHVLLWDFFFQLYRQAAPICRQENFEPVGPLFYRGFKISMTLAKMKKRIQNTIIYHENEIKTTKEAITKMENTFIGGEDDLMQMYNDAKAMLAYHQAVVKYFQCFVLWLDESRVNAPLPQMSHVNEVLGCPILLTPYYIEDAKLSNEKKKPPAEIPRQEEKVSPVRRIKVRLEKETVPITPNKPKVLIPIEKVDEKSTLFKVKEWMQQLKHISASFDNDRSLVQVLNNKMMEATSRLYSSKPFKKIERRSCGEKCTGDVKIIVTGMEWILSDEVQRQINDILSRRKRTLTQLQTPNAQTARMASSLIHLHSYTTDPRTATDIFWMLMDALDNPFVVACPPICGTVQTCVIKLNKYVTISDTNLLDILGGEYGNVASTIGTQLARDRTTSPAFYAALLRSEAPSHVVYSLLSKFLIKDLTDRMGCNEICDILDAQFDALVRIGVDPSMDTMPLLEVVCTHTGMLIKSQPFLVSICVRLMARNAAKGNISVRVTEILSDHIAVAAIPIDSDQLMKICMSVGDMWREEDAWKKNAACAEQNADLIYNLLKILSKRPEACLLCIQCVWNSWESWTGGADTSLYLKLILDHYPAYTDQILCEWLCAMLRVHRVLSRKDLLDLHPQILAERPTFYHVGLLPVLLEMSNGSAELRSWLVSAMSSLRSANWTNPHMTGLQLVNTFRLLTSLPFDLEVLDEAAENLPWDLLSVDQFEMIFHEFVKSCHTNSDPCFYRINFRLVLGAGSRKHLSESLVAGWVSLIPTCTKSKEATSHLLVDINKIFRGVAKQIPVTDEQIKHFEAVLGRVVVLLSVQPLAKQVLPEFRKYVKSASPKVVRACLRVVCDITLSDIFLQLSETIMECFLVEGNWSDLLTIWKNACFVSEALTSATPLVIAATIFSSDLADHWLSLEQIKPTEDEEAKICAAFCALIHKGGSVSGNARNAVSAWAAPPPSLIARTFTRVTIVTTRFRAASRMTLSCMQSTIEKSTLKAEIVQGYEDIMNDFFTSFDRNSAPLSVLLANAFSKLYPDQKNMFEISDIVSR